MREIFGKILFISLLAIILIFLFAFFGLKTTNLEFLPLVFIAFFFANKLDVPLKGLGFVNADHIVSFSSLFLFQNPIIPAILNGVSYLLERITRKGIKELSYGHFISFLSSIITNSLSLFLLLKSGAFLKESNILVSLFYLIISLTIYALLDFLLLIAGKFFIEEELNFKEFFFYLVKYVLFLLISSPFLAIFITSLTKNDLPLVLIASFPLIVSIWFLKVNFSLLEKNLELISLTRKQEFLQQLLLKETGSLDNQYFFETLLKGLNDFVEWDKDLIIISSIELTKHPIIFSLHGCGENPHDAISSINEIIEKSEKFIYPVLNKGSELKPLLLKRAKYQLIIPLSTEEICFGAMILEKEKDPPFTKAEIQFLHSAMTQVARILQDKILKEQLLTTNHTLLRQTHYLTQILKISNLLKIHLSPKEILEEVAKGISQSIGFQRVLISLYRKDEKCFERYAHYGLNDIWEKVSSVRPPEENILRHFKEENKIGNCYFVRNVTPTQYTILPNRNKTPETDKWQPDDALFVPLLNRDNTLLGVISMDEPIDGQIPSLETLSALEILANQAIHALESAEIHSQVKHEAIVDGLTNLYNHRYFQESLSFLLKKASVSKSVFSILMMDLDNFKEINDTYGHLSGDTVLKSVAQTILEVIRKEDIAARYGGEEFAILLNGIDLRQARIVAERIRALVEKRVIMDETIKVPLKVTISIGIASYPLHATEQKELIKIADLALYRAKQSGKNRIAEGP